MLNRIPFFLHILFGVPFFLKVLCTLVDRKDKDLKKRGSKKRKVLTFLLLFKIQLMLILELKLLNNLIKR